MRANTQRAGEESKNAGVRHSLWSRQVHLPRFVFLRWDCTIRGKGPSTATPIREIPYGDLLMDFLSALARTGKFPRKPRRLDYRPRGGYIPPVVSHSLVEVVGVRALLGGTSEEKIPPKGGIPTSPTVESKSTRERMRRSTRVSGSGWSTAFTLFLLKGSA